MRAIRSAALAALLVLPAAAQQTTPAPGAPAAPTAGAASDSHGFASATRFGQRDGGALYAASCAGCHMPDGRGAVGAGAYPPLANNPKLEAAGYPVTVVLNGLRGMPGFGSQMDDAQVAAVVNWVRTNLGNAYAADPARPEDVRSLRP